MTALLSVSATIGWLAALLGWARCRHLSRTIEQLCIELLLSRTEESK